MSIDLSIFADTERGRYDLDKPWVEDGVAYATDGRIAVRLWKPGLFEGEYGDPAGRYPRVTDVLNGWPKGASWFDWPPTPRCEACGGHSPKAVTCSECGGSKRSECPHCEQEMECEECGGKGKIVRRCSECPNVMVGGRHISNMLARKIATLPNVQWAVPDDNPESAVFFRFDGGDGAVMPLSVPACEVSR